MSEFRRSTRRCYICKNICSPFFNWTSSRIFPVEKMLKMLERMKEEDKMNMKNIKDGEKVCFACFDKLKKI